LPHQKLMLVKAFILIIIAVMVLSCKKDSVEPFDAKNKLNATITLSSGEVKEFLATGSKVTIGCAAIGGSYILADQSPVAINLGYINGYNCITAPGTYDYNCNYYPDKNSQSSPIYMGWSSHKQGSITYTVVNGKYVEGYFEAVCTTDTDAVTLKGTFSGYLK